MLGTQEEWLRELIATVWAIDRIDQYVSDQGFALSYFIAFQRSEEPSLLALPALGCANRSVPTHSNHVCIAAEELPAHAY